MKQRQAIYHSIVIFLAMLGSCAVVLQAIDFPNYYRANFFYGLPLHINKDWESYNSARYGTGETRIANDCHGNKVSILNTFGLEDVNVLGINVDTNGSCNTPPKPLTAEYLGPDGVIPSFGFTCNDGKLSFEGKFETWEVDIDWWQNLVYGFYLYTYVPVRHLQITDICYKNLTNPNNPNAAAFQDFLNNEFDAVLQENGLLPLCTPYYKTGLSDPALFLGWHGDKQMPPGFISDLAGLIQTGVTFPTSPLPSPCHIFEVPLGYNNHWGLGFRAQFEAGILGWFGFGVTLGTNVFLDKKQPLRMITSPCAQAGHIMLESGYVAVNPGQMWDIGGYVKADRFLKGFGLLLGYSYTKRERTRLNVKDCNFLHMLKDEQCAYGTYLNKVTPNSIVNQAQNIAAWDMHVLHIIVELDLEPVLKTRIAPNCSFFFNWIFTGNRSWRTNMLGGTGGLRIKWDF